jgi:hypothetical protein
MKRVLKRIVNWVMKYRKQIYLLSLFMSIPAWLLRSLFRIQHWPGTGILFACALLLTLVYTAIALLDLYKKEEESVYHKIAWVIGFVVSAPLVGLAYYYLEFKSGKE